ncbi:MAG: serine hydrolase [Planctomycetota bacterium]
MASSCRLFCLLLCSLILLSSCAPLQDRNLNTDPALLSDSFKEDLQAYQDSLIDEEITGSNFLMVVRDGKEIYRSTTNSGRSGDRDITDKTLFPIWSMSKPITIVAMHLLHEQGLFQLGGPGVPVHPLL